MPPPREADPGWDHGFSPQGRVLQCIHLPGAYDRNLFGKKLTETGRRLNYFRRPESPRPAYSLLPAEKQSRNNWCRRRAKPRIVSKEHGFIVGQVPSPEVSGFRPPGRPACPAPSLAARSPKPRGRPIPGQPPPDTEAAPPLPCPRRRNCACADREAAAGPIPAGKPELAETRFRSVSVPPAFPTAGGFGASGCVLGHGRLPGSLHGLLLLYAAFTSSRARSALGLSDPLPSTQYLRGKRLKRTPQPLECEFSSRHLFNHSFLKTRAFS